MLGTRVKRRVFIKVTGTDLKEIDCPSSEIERAIKSVPGVTSAVAERLMAGRYVDVGIDRATDGAVAMV